jgi:hypothetical protein
MDVVLSYYAGFSDRSESKRVTELPLLRLEMLGFIISLLLLSLFNLGLIAGSTSSSYSSSSS